MRIDNLLQLLLGIIHVSDSLATEPSPGKKSQIAINHQNGDFDEVLNATAWSLIVSLRCYSTTICWTLEVHIPIVHLCKLGWQCTAHCSCQYDLSPTPFGITRESGCHQTKCWHVVLSSHTWLGWEWCCVNSTWSGRNESIFRLSCDWSVSPNVFSNALLMAADLGILLQRLEAWMETSLANI